MSIWMITQIGLNVFFLGLVLWLHRSRSLKEDTQKDRNLQIIQSKIAVLEDLSDQTEVQAKQLIALINKKSHQFQNVSPIQDKSPDSEKQKRVQYITAAKMAHQGHSKKEIAKKVGLPDNELNFIMKIHQLPRATWLPSSKDE